MAGSLLGGLLDRIVLLAGTVAGGCVPGFLAQYRQRAGGRLDQVLADLAPFREIAERRYGGSLEELIRHHLASTDPTFRDEGLAIQMMVDAEARMRAIVEALRGGVWEQFLHVLAHPDRALMTATWSDYVPSFTLDLQGITMALVVGLSLWLVFLLLWRGLATLGRLIAGPRTPDTRRPGAGGGIGPLDRL